MYLLCNLNLLELVHLLRNPFTPACDVISCITRISGFAFEITVEKYGLRSAAVEPG